MVLPSSLIKIWGNSVNGFMSSVFWIRIQICWIRIQICWIRNILASWIRIRKNMRDKGQGTKYQPKTEEKNLFTLKTQIWSCFSKKKKKNYLTILLCKKNL